MAYEMERMSQEELHLITPPPAADLNLCLHSLCQDTEA